MKETDGLYYFNRCRKCAGLITKLTVPKAFKTGGEVCPCGSLMFGPTNPVGIEWLKPAALKMCVYQILGWLAPAPCSEVAPVLPGGFQSVPSLDPREIRAPEEGEK